MCLVDELVSRAYGAHPPGLVGSQYHAHPGLPGVPVISPVFPLRVSLCGCVAPRRRAPATARCGRRRLQGVGRPECQVSVRLRSGGKVSTAVASAGGRRVSQPVREAP